MPARGHAPLPLRLYSVLSSLVGPLVYPRVAKKLQAHGTAPERLKEREGIATERRPKGPLLWCHAASVGESLSVLRLIAHLGVLHSELSFLLTSGTATSAQIVANRLPPRTRHQFAPIDTPKSVNRFFDHWTPDAAVFVESELWPNMLNRAQAAGIPLALVNARISEKSAQNWARAPATARHLMQAFRMIHCQDTRTETHLRTLGLTQAAKGANLKAMAAPLPVDMEEKRRVGQLIKGRPFWLASSTHPGEDEIVLDAHNTVLETHANALLILVPRHTDRAADIASLITGAKLRLTQRTLGQDPASDAEVYLADTLGETGLWYALAPMTCLCGSFSIVGGHNPFEPAQGGSAILHGPHYANFSQVYAEFDAAGAAREVSDAKALSDAVLHLMGDDTARHALADHAKTLSHAQDKGLDDIARDLSKALELG
ncbi:MAG: 3-deoxy-D-manno-octulosonic acid transferase [Pseudomonadota bacterium]